MTDKEPLPKGTRVRLKNDPGRKGYLTGRSRPRAGVLVYSVKFDGEGVSNHPDYALQVLDENSDDDPWEMLENASFGNARDLRRNLTHIQLSGRLANLVYSMDATNTEFFAYQYKPVLSFLEATSKGLLIADEVGLGKTIEAGLIWTELRARYDARRLLVVCPAMLREKWEAELKNRFGVLARIVDASELTRHLKEDKRSVPDGHGLVCSIQGLRPPKDWDDAEGRGSPRAKLAKLLDEMSSDEPIVDLVIIDEAHYLRNPESQSAKLGRMLRDVSDHILLLSATPINLHSDDLFHLLNLVDPDSFGVREIFPRVLEANEPLQRARLLSLDTTSDAALILDELYTARQHDLLRDSRQLAGLLDATKLEARIESKAGRVELANRIERINLLQHVVSRTRKVEVTEWRVIREPKTYFVQLDPDGPERAFYDRVTQSIRSYAVERDVSEGFLLATPQKQVASCMVAAATAWRERTSGAHEVAYEDLGTDSATDREFSPLIDHLCRTALPDVDVSELRKNDSKYNSLLGLLKDYFGRHPREKVVVFSFFRGTIRYLSERLTSDGIANATLVGGMAKSKQDIIDHFRYDEGLRVLISSEVASEGVDLQFCRVLVNYDLPWNPMKVEQRIGRIDRIGQTADRISIRNLCYGDTIDQRIHERLLQRLDVFRRALGGMEAILGEKIGSLAGDLLSHDLTPEEENRRIDDTALAIERIRQDEQDLEKQASHLIAHGGYILEQVKAARQFKRQITAEDLTVYVKDYLDRYGVGYEFQQLRHDQPVFDLRLPASVANALGDYLRQFRLFGRTDLATGDRIRCRFANKIHDFASREETISQFHPLVRFISHDLRRREEVFTPLVAMRLHHRFVPGLLPDKYAFKVGRWSFEGLRTDEELRARAVSLADGHELVANDALNLVNVARIDGTDWLSAASDVDRALLKDALEYCEDALQEEYEAVARDREDENRDRVRLQIQSAENYRDRRVSTLRQVLQEHKVKGSRLVAATEGKIRKHQERFELELERLRKREVLLSRPYDVVFGVVEVQ